VRDEGRTNNRGKSPWHLVDFEPETESQRLKRRPTGPHTIIILCTLIFTFFGRQDDKIKDSELNNSMCLFFSLFPMHMYTQYKHAQQLCVQNISTNTLKNKQVERVVDHALLLIQTQKSNAVRNVV
jgi:hypothetical protein